MSELIYNGTAQQLAYRFIRDQILSGTYGGGMRINPTEVGKLLGISRMPVRDAIQQLDAEGLVTIRVNRGATVTVLTAAEVEELFEMRAVLEAWAVRLALKRLTPEDLAELEDRRQRMDRVRGDAKLWIDRHNEFHDFLCQKSGRPRLAAEVRRVRAAVQPYILMHISVYNSTEMEGYEHAELLEALHTADPERIEAAMRDHVMNANRGIVEHLLNRS